MLVRTGRSGSLRDQPKELTESRKVVEAMIPVQTPADLIKREGYKHVSGYYYKRIGVF